MNKFYVFKDPINSESDLIFRLYIERFPKNILALFTMVGLWCIFLWNAFGADRSFAIFQDNEIGLGPVASGISTMLRHGEWPLRLDTILGGVPLYNYTQMTAFYPGYLFLLPIYGSPFDVIHSMHWVTLIHLLVLEINTFIFLRVIGASRLAAIVGSVLFTFSANNFTYAVWFNIVVPYSWFPLYLAGLVGILKYPQSKRFSAMALGGIVLLVLASPSQPLIHAVFMTIVFVCTYLYDHFRTRETKQILYTLARVIAVAVLALLLVAPALLPAGLEFKNMIRWIGYFPPVIGNARIPFEAFQTDQLTIADLGGVFFKFKGAAVGNQFAGVLTIALTSVAVVTRPRSWIIVALTFIAAYSIISSTGSNLGLAYINYIIPILNKIREPSRFLGLLQFAVFTHSALGIDALSKKVFQTEDHANTKRQLIALTVIAVIAIITLLVVPERIVSNVSPFISIAVLITLTLMTWMATTYNKLWGHNTMLTAVWGGIAITLLAIEVPWIPPPISSSIFFTSGALALDTATERVATLDPKHEYRVLFDGKIEKQQAAMLASYRGVRTFNSYFNPAPRQQFEELYYHGPRTDNYFRILGAKYLICDECTKASLQGYKHLENVAGYEIYETQDVLPHSYIVQRLNGEFSSLADFTTKAATADLSKGLLFVEPNAVVGLNEAKNDCIRREDIRTVNHSRFVVQCKSAGLLVMNEFFDKAWKTTVDGVKTQSLRVNGNQIGVHFIAGSHIIEFQYLPRIFLLALGLMFTGILILAFLIWKIWKRG